MQYYAFTSQPFLWKQRRQKVIHSKDSSAIAKTKASTYKVIFDANSAVCFTLCKPGQKVLIIDLEILLLINFAKKIV